MPRGAVGGEVEGTLGCDDETFAIKEDAADGAIDEGEVEGGGLVGGGIDVAPDLDLARGEEDGGDIVAGPGEEDIAGFLGEVRREGAAESKPRTSSTEPKREAMASVPSVEVLAASAS